MRAKKSFVYKNGVICENIDVMNMVSIKLNETYRYICVQKWCCLQECRCDEWEFDEGDEVQKWCTC